MIATDATPWEGDDEAMLDRLRTAYDTLMPEGMTSDLARVVSCLDGPDPRHVPGKRLAVVAEADREHRALTKMLLEETELGVVECASAEAALAVLVREADKTVFMLADSHLAGDRGVDALTTTVRLLWPGIHVATTTEAADAPRATDPEGVVRLSRPWCGLDVLIEAERALARAD